MESPKASAPRRAARVSLSSIPRTALVALLGPSGSGKTTLLRILGGWSPRLGAGAVRQAGRHWHDRCRSGGGLCVQNYALFRHMTVFDNIAYGLRARPRAKRPRKAEIFRAASPSCWN